MWKNLSWDYGRLVKFSLDTIAWFSIQFHFPGKRLIFFTCYKIRVTNLKSYTDQILLLWNIKSRAKISIQTLGGLMVINTCIDWSFPLLYVIRTRHFLRKYYEKKYFLPYQVAIKDKLIIGFFATLETFAWNLVFTGISSVIYFDLQVIQVLWQCILPNPYTF